MDIKDKKAIAIHALETARFAVYLPLVCKDMLCRDCPLYTDKGVCIFSLLNDMLYKAIEGKYL